MEIANEDGHINSDHDHVIDIWKKEFSNLCNGLSSDESDFYQSHYIIAKSHRQTLELSMMDPPYSAIRNN